MATLETTDRQPRVEITGDVATMHRDGETTTHELQALPERFVRWQLEYKHGIYDAIEKEEYIAFNAGHLPVVGTWERGALVPNLANKGVGFTPKDEHLEHYLAKVEAAVAEIERYPAHAVAETRHLRVGVARELYSNPDHLDWRRLQLLEIFEGTTYKHLTKNPVASVLWTGTSPAFVSFQVDCLCEIIDTDDPRYRFAWAMRRLFEFEPFHVVQTIFPYAYCFWVIGTKEKTPKRRYPGKRSDHTVNEGGGKIQ